MNSLNTCFFKKKRHTVKPHLRKLKLFPNNTYTTNKNSNHHSQMSQRNLIKNWLRYDELPNLKMHSKKAQN